MTENIDKAYVQRQVDRAKSTNSELVKNDALYRVGTQMEILECNGDIKLAPEQQQQILDAADRLLGGK